MDFVTGSTLTMDLLLVALSQDPLAVDFNRIVSPSFARIVMPCFKERVRAEGLETVGAAVAVPVEPELAVCVPPEEGFVDEVSGTFSKDIEIVFFE